MTAPKFACLMVVKSPDGQIASRLAEAALADLPPGDVLIRVGYSSLNYKDALALSGHPGVARQFPLVAGIDLAGVVEQAGGQLEVGQEVLATGFDLGTSHWGGYAQYARLPAQWVLPLPRGLTLRESMILGTAGLTAGMCVDALERHDVRPADGELLVTGASGGVGCLAVAILAKLGYRVVAATGKPQAHDLLHRLGVARIVPRAEVDDASPRPLLSARWAGAIDTVGGNTLATVIRSTAPGGCVAACGLVGGTELMLTVYPFILRGVALQGIDSAYAPLEARRQIWQRLAGPWKPDSLELVANEIDLAAVIDQAAKMRAGQSLGRVVVRLSSDS